MPASPTVSVAWGNEWRRCSRRSVRPTVEAAVDLAVEGFAALEVPLTTPKQVLVRRTVRGYEDAGCAIEPGLIEIYLSTDAVKRGKVPRILGLLSVVGFHEMVHDERYNLFPREDLVEFVATEGLAHCADTMFARRLLPDHEFHDSIEASQILCPHRVSQLVEALYDDSEFDGVSDPEVDTDLYDLWMEDERPEYLDYPMGVLLGARCVSQHLSDGVSLSELLHWEPEAIVSI